MMMPCGRFSPNEPAWTSPCKNQTTSRNKMKTNEIRDTKEQEKALALHIALSKVDLSDISILNNERHISRKEQALLARQLFASLGLKGISVTAPNYSMAQSVDVRLPKREDYAMTDSGFVVDGDVAASANNEATAKVRQILNAAFPSHDDRSDSQTDYFDYCWSL